ncbi:ribonuclease H-like YkuK family protein [Candidatus Giovannonibacteria bacterium]|nr:ribonuclease H-like YkuK family protein [Candidatus Giovannonibacteria bacterium]
MSKEVFFNFLGNTLTLDAVIAGISDFIKKEPGRKYKIIIGTDSMAANETFFVSAVTVWRVGNGGIHFWSRSEKIKCHNLRDRINREAIQSITLAQEVRGRLKETLGDEFFWDDQVHIDIGRQGPTKEFVDSIVGMVKAYGFEAVIKPYSFGASVVADRHT